RFAPSTKVDVTLWRGGAEQKVSVTLGKLPGEEGRADATPQTPDAPASAATLDDFSLTVAPADDGEGLVVTEVEPDSPAAERGIEVGDVIVSVNSSPVASAEDVDRAVGE